MSDGKALVHRWFKEVWNQGREATIDELFPPEAVTFGLGEIDSEVRGPDQFKPFHRNLRTAFPDLHITIQDTIAEDDKVVVRFLVEGTHKGQGLDIAPTGRKIHLSGMSLLRVGENKILAGWNNWDQLGMLRQLGVIPPAHADRFFEKH